MGDLALVYRGRAARPEGCSEAVAALLRSSSHGFDVRYIGAGEELPLTPEVLSGAVVYAQPGGGELRPAFRRMRRHRRTIRDHVTSGGVYLGFCLGGYLAGATPGFSLLPGDTDRHTAGGGGPVDGGRDTTVDVRWRGRTRRMFFQDGAEFLLRPGAPGVEVLARYADGPDSDGGVAALTARFGAGAVGVVGPHPEATPDWYRDAGLAPPPHETADLGHDLIDAALRAADPHPRRRRQ